MKKDEAYYMAMAEFLDEIFFSDDKIKDELKALKLKMGLLVKDEVAYKGDNIEIKRKETKDKIILELSQ